MPSVASQGVLAKMGNTTFKSMIDEAGSYPESRAAAVSSRRAEAPTRSPPPTGSS